MIGIMPNFTMAISRAEEELRLATKFIETMSWQGVDVTKKPDMNTHEAFNHSFCVAMTHEDLIEYQFDINPNLPWADDHFAERVSGKPLNPGVQWAKWPYAHSADKFRELPNGQFNHTYMERFWPKWAGGYMRDGLARQGIRGIYGDLDDVIKQLARDPTTRQAYLPIFFPEDTGAVNGGRIPCTLGYHFIMRYNYLHIVYYIRSCDFIRHFRDDIYLTVRLLLWVLNRLREDDSAWNDITPGSLTMHITSLHMFHGDYIRKFHGESK